MSAPVILDVADLGHAVPGPWTSVRSIVEPHREQGWHFFDDRSAISHGQGNRVYGGRLFITGDTVGDTTRFSIRLADDGARVCDVSLIGQFATWQHAQTAACALVRAALHEGEARAA